MTTPPTIPQTSHTKLVVELNRLVLVFDQWTLGDYQNVTDYSAILKYMEARLGEQAQWCLSFQETCKSLGLL